MFLGIVFFSTNGYAMAADNYDRARGSLIRVEE
jgi:hypothetical protein